MRENNPTFDIISFTPDSRQYYPTYMDRQTWMLENCIKHSELEISLGHSRYGGCVIDLPKDFNIPNNLHFAGQFDLSKFSPFDKSGLLPKTGHLFCFADIRKDIGKIIYAKTPSHELVRIIKEHEEDFFLGVLIEKIFADTESWAERFDTPTSDNDAERKWNDYAGMEKSKMFGIFTHCQYSQQEIEEITFSNKILLLQIGENGFNDEGVFSVTIDKEDLKHLNFENCEFSWGQT